MIVSKREVEMRSYLIWEREGCPQGCDWDHWFRAEAELAREQTPPQKAATGASPRSRASQAQKGTAARKGTAKKH